MPVRYIRRSVGSFLLVFVGLTLLAFPQTTSQVRLTSAALLVGNSSVQPWGDTDTAGMAEALQYAASASGSVNSITLYVNTGNRATSVAVGLYSDAGGRPGGLLTHGVIAAPKAAAWDTVNVAAAPVTAGTKYWLALLGLGGEVHFRDLISGGAPTQNSAQTTLTGLPSTWSSGHKWANSPASFYASTTGTPSSTPTPTSTTSATPKPTPTSTPMPTPTPTPTPIASSTPTPAPTPTTGCTAPRDTPGGPDPWGGCFPGPNNTGVPAGTKLVEVVPGIQPPDSQLPSDNRGWIFSASEGYIRVTQQNAVIDDIYEPYTYSIYLQANTSLTVKNSEVGYIEDGYGLSLTVENSTINAGTLASNRDLYSSVTGGTNITVLNSNLYGGGHEVLCYGNCNIQNNWLHDNADGRSVGAHQNGFLTIGGSNFNIQHNSVYCVGGCTSDIALLGSGESNALVNKNLLVASTYAAMCIYPAAGHDASYNWTVGTNIVITNNIFQRGANGHCAVYRPVYGWPATTPAGDVWSGNTWDDGSVLNP